MEKTRILTPQNQQPIVLIRKMRGSSESTPYAIKRTTTSIGRSPGNDIVLVDFTVSRYHAAIRLEDNGYFIYDFASTNGTFVNCRRVFRKKLVDGDIIQLGQSLFAFISKETPPSLTPQRSIP